MTNKSEETETAIEEAIKDGDTLKAHCLLFKEKCTQPLWDAIKSKVSITLFIASVAYISGSYVYTWTVERTMGDRIGDHELAIQKLDMNLSKNNDVVETNSKQQKQILDNQKEIKDLLITAINKK